MERVAKLCLWLVLLAPLVGAGCLAVPRLGGLVDRPRPIPSDESAYTQTDFRELGRQWSIRNSLDAYKKVEIGRASCRERV